MYAFRETMQKEKLWPWFFIFTATNRNNFTDFWCALFFSLKLACMKYKESYCSHPGRLRPRLCSSFRFKFFKSSTTHQKAFIKQLRQTVERTSVRLVILIWGSWSEGQHDLYFTVHWFCLISWRLLDIWSSYFRIMSQYGPTIDLKINACDCDLYFMVQWFCVISWRLFNVWTSYFGSMSQYDTTFDLKKCKSLWPIFHGPVILPYILKTIWFMNTILWDYESIWPDVWPKNKCRSLWPIFHGPLILAYILRIIQWLNIILQDNESG